MLRDVGIADGGQAELSEALWHSEAVAGAQRLVVMGANTWGLCVHTTAPGSAPTHPQNPSRDSDGWRCRQRERRGKGFVMSYRIKAEAGRELG